MNIGEILIVDSDERMPLLLKNYLEKYEYKVSIKHTFKEGIAYFKSHNIALVISEIMMDNEKDFAMLLAIRKLSNIPVLLLSSKNTDSVRIQAFKNGADDFVAKPFSSEEVYLRLKRLLDYFYSSKQFKIIGNQYIFSFMTVDKIARTVEIDHKTVDLSVKEFDLLLYLVEHYEDVVSREVLLKEVWNYTYFGEKRTVDTYIKNLRKKLEDFSKPASCSIVTVWKRGYRFNPNV